jgi:hypothetical protein
MKKTWIVVVSLCAFFVVGGCAVYEESEGLDLPAYESQMTTHELPTITSKAGMPQICQLSVTINPSDYQDSAKDVAIDSTGIYVIGTDEQNAQGDLQWRIEKRSHRDGSIIWVQTSNPVQDSHDAWDKANALALDSTGLYVVGSDIQLRLRYQWRIEKRDLIDGNLLWVKTGNEGGSATDVAVDQSGIYVVGEDRPEPGGLSRWVVEKRSLTDGSTLWRRTYDQTDHEDLARSVALTSDAVYVVGRQGGRQSYRTRLEKRNLDDGTLVWIQSGDSPTPYPGNFADKVAVDASGVYLAGTQSTDIPNYQWLIEKRDHQSGDLIWRQTYNPSDSTDTATAVAVDETGLYVAGYDSVPGTVEHPWISRWRIEKRNLSDGELVWDRLFDPNDGGSPNAIALDAECIHVVGSDESLKSDSNPVDRQWRIERMSL